MKNLISKRGIVYDFMRYIDVKAKGLPKPTTISSQDYESVTFDYYVRASYEPVHFLFKCDCDIRKRKLNLASFRMIPAILVMTFYSFVFRQKLSVI